VCDARAIAPFFRIPGLLQQNSVEQYLAAHNYMTWSVDFLADDWTHINSQEVARRAIERIEARGRGILLLHDIQPATALALPDILKELKTRGFKIVHVVPATADRPKTVSEPEQWVARRTPEQHVWPRPLMVGAGAPEPLLAIPSPESFGIVHFGEPVVRVALEQTLEGPVMYDGEPPLSPVPTWPRAVVNAAQSQPTVLPAPGVQNFRYSRPFRLGKPRETQAATRKRAAIVRASAKNQTTTHRETAGAPAAGGPPRTPRTVGHQLTVMRRSIMPWSQWQ
jgi:hypothetical protein